MEKMFIVYACDGKSASYIDGYGTVWYVICFAEIPKVAVMEGPSGNDDGSDSGSASD